MYSGLIRDWPKRVCFGVGSVRELPRLLDDIGAGRAGIVCGRSVASGPILAAVKAALGARCAGVFDGVPAHTPYTAVQAAAAALTSCAADCVVSVGGGSTIDAGKGVVLLAATGGEFAPYAIDYGAKGSMARAPMPPSPIKHIAVRAYKAIIRGLAEGRAALSEVESGELRELQRRAHESPELVERLAAVAAKRAKT